MAHDFDDDEFNGVPLPPEDRLWRHPSELRHLAGAGAPTSAAHTPTAPTAVPVAAPERPRRSIGLAAAAFLAGAGLVGSLWFTLGSTNVRSVYLTERVPMQPLDSTPPRLVSPENWAEEVASATWPSLARVQLDDATPLTALVLRDDGLVVTAAGPLGNQRAVELALPTGDVVRATVLGSDPVTDLAVLHVDADDLVPAVLSRDHVMQQADSVAIVGVASADALVERSTVTGDTTVAHSDSGFHPDLVPVDLDQAAPGSAVLDASGSVIGVLTSVHDGATAYALPIDTARELAVTIAARDDIRHDGWMGVDPRNVDVRADAAAAVRSAIEVRSVVPGGPADIGGLHVGDEIATVAGRQMGDEATFATLVRSLEPGQIVTVEVLRMTLAGDVQVVPLEIELGARPAR